MLRASRAAGQPDIRRLCDPTVRPGKGGGLWVAAGGLAEALALSKGTPSPGTGVTARRRMHRAHWRCPRKPVPSCPAFTRQRHPALQNSPKSFLYPARGGPGGPALQEVSEFPWGRSPSESEHSRERSASCRAGGTMPTCQRWPARGERGVWRARPAPSGSDPSLKGHSYSRNEAARSHQQAVQFLQATSEQRVCLPGVLRAPAVRRRRGRRPTQGVLGAQAPARPADAVNRLLRDASWLAWTGTGLPERRQGRWDHARRKLAETRVPGRAETRRLWTAAQQTSGAHGVTFWV